MLFQRGGIGTRTFSFFFSRRPIVTSLIKQNHRFAKAAPVCTATFRNGVERSNQIPCTTHVVEHIRILVPRFAITLEHSMLYVIKSRHASPRIRLSATHDHARCYHRAVSASFCWAQVHPINIEVLIPVCQLLSSPTQPHDMS